MEEEEKSLLQRIDDSLESSVLEDLGAKLMEVRKTAPTKVVKK